MARRLPITIQCPSVSESFELAHEPCSGAACSWWENGCSARRTVESEYLQHETTLAPECPLAPRCRWHLDALAGGQVGCVVRRLGMLCEHQGGEWNTFEMAPASEWNKGTEPND